MKQKESKISAEHIINIVIVSIGVVLVVFGALAKKQNISTIMFSIGASLIASSIVAFLSSIYIQKYRHAQEISETWGISSVEETRAIMNIRIDACIDKAKKHYDIMAYGLKSLRDAKSQEVSDMLERGVSIRILSVSPDCKALADRDTQEKKQVGSTSLSISQLIEWVDELDKRFPGKIQIRLSDHLPSEFYCRVDNSIFVGPYQYGKESQQDFTLEFKSPGKAFIYYSMYFDSLWNDSEYCRKP